MDFRTWWASSEPQNHDDSNHKIVSPFNYSSCKYRLPISDVHLNDCQGLPIHPASIRTRQVYDDDDGWSDKERPQNLSAQPASQPPTALVIGFWHNLKTSVLSLSKPNWPAFLCSRACVTEPGVSFKPLCFPSMLMSFTPDCLLWNLYSPRPVSDSPSAMLSYKRTSYLDRRTCSLIRLPSSAFLFVSQAMNLSARTRDLVAPRALFISIPRTLRRFVNDD